MGFYELMKALDIAIEEKIILQGDTSLVMVNAVLRTAPIYRNIVEGNARSSITSNSIEVIFRKGIFNPLVMD